jgi:hypothetical protein
MSDIAYSADVELHEAKWTDKDGSTVTFKLPMAGMEGQRNPFEKWTKRRKGHAGTRFMMACQHVKGMVPVYADEVMLTGWNDSQTTGHTVKFWLVSDTLGHPFEGFERGKDRFAISLVELDDDQEPIDQEMRDKVESSRKRSSERLSYAAAMMCKNEGFWTYINETQNGPVQVGGENGARIWLCMMCNIDSRAQLDDPEESLAIEAFHDIRHKFLDWQQEGYS